MMISSAWAQAADAAPPSTLAQFVPLILVIVVFYFLMIRPQMKRARAHQEMVASLRRGDRVVTSGGIVGVIAKIDDEEHISVEIAPDVVVKVMRSTISQTISKSDAATKANKGEDVVKGKPVANDGADKAPAKAKKASPKGRRQ